MSTIQKKQGFNADRLSCVFGLHNCGQNHHILLYLIPWKWIQISRLLCGSRADFNHDYIIFIFGRNDERNMMFCHLLI